MVWKTSFWPVKPLKISAYFPTAKKGEKLLFIADTFSGFLMLPFFWCIH